MKIFTMDINTFNKMSLQEKERFVNEGSSFVANIDFHSFKLRLYKLGNHLYEVWESETKSKIEKIEMIPDVKNLPIYIKKANIDHLL